MVLPPGSNHTTHHNHNHNHSHHFSLTPLLRLRLSRQARVAVAAMVALCAVLALVHVGLIRVASAHYHSYYSSTNGHTYTAVLVRNPTPTPTPTPRPPTGALDYGDPTTGLLPNQLTFVLLTRLADREGFPRVWTLLLSVLKFAEPTLLHTLVVVVPDSDYDVLVGVVRGIQRYCVPACRFAVKPVKDSMLLSSSDQTVYARLTPELEQTSRGGRGVNYRVQMLLKLAVAAVVPTAFYLTLDSDVVMVRQTRFAELVVGGRAIYQGETAMNTRHRPSWWESADRFLHARGCYRNLTTVVGVTPALLSTTLARGFLRDASKENQKPNSSSSGGGGTPWDIALFQGLQRGLDWTEYTLYWTYACREGALETYHTLSPTGLRLYDYSGFEFGSFRSWRPEQEFNQQEQQQEERPSAPAGANLSTEARVFPTNPAGAGALPRFAPARHPMPAGSGARIQGGNLAVVGGGGYGGDGPPHVFSVLQSISGADPAQVNSQVLPFVT